MRTCPPTRASMLGADERGGGGARGSSRFALLLDVEGVLVDLHRNGHMEAINASLSSAGFESLRIDNTRYRMLYGRCGGSFERLIFTLLDESGSLPPSSDSHGRKSLVKRIMEGKSVALLESVARGGMALRPGVVDFLYSASSLRVPVAVLTATARCGEGIGSALLSSLPPALLSSLVLVGRAEVNNSAYAHVALGGGAQAGGVEDALAAQVAHSVMAEKQRLAQQVAQMLQIAVDLDTPSESSFGVAAFRTAAELLHSPPSSCVVLAGAQATVQLAARAAMTVCVLRSSMTSGAEFPGARAVFDGLGAGALTLPRLQRLVVGTPPPPPPPSTAAPPVIR